MRCLDIVDTATTPLNNTILSLGTTKVSKIHAIYNYPSATGTGSAAIDIVPKVTLQSSSATTSFQVGEVIVGRTSGSKGRIIKESGNTLYFVYLSTTNFILMKHYLDMLVLLKDL
ncbi:MAG: hypothetical protein CM15mV5_2950 [uncultured marine virus]|nr:MAG: hypothetical protein CM15mV5_2950 [uncultured marine virus]